MKGLALICLGFLTGCATATNHLPAPYTTFTRQEELVRSTNLLLRITSHERQADGSYRITARGIVENKDFGCSVTIPAKWEESYAYREEKRVEFRDLREANMVLKEDGPGGAELDALVQRYEPHSPSVFAKAGFAASTIDNLAEIERRRIQINGWGPFDEYGHLEFLMLIDVPSQTLKLAFLRRGYGEPMLKEVTEWIQKKD